MSSGKRMMTNWWRVTEQEHPKAVTVNPSFILFWRSFLELTRYQQSALDFLLAFLHYSSFFLCQSTGILPQKHPIECNERLSLDWVTNKLVSLKSFKTQTLLEPVHTKRNGTQGSKQRQKPPSTPNPQSCHLPKHTVLDDKARNTTVHPFPTRLA